MNRQLLKRVERAIKDLDIDANRVNIYEYLKSFDTKEDIDKALDYLNKMNVIYEGRKGITWIKASKKLQKILKSRKVKL